MVQAKRARRRAFSLIELVIVVVIIGIIAAIAIPKLTHAATSASESALTGDLAVLRQAIDLYQADHGNLPDPNNITTQLLTTTAADGSVGTGGIYVYGPYMKAIPNLPVGSAPDRSRTGIGPQGAWIYTVDPTGKNFSLSANTTATDIGGNSYSAY